ncbi:dessication-associated protein [Mucilaginibacter sp. PPCGB 2223]|uniref:ferritin-like domain-containing protein n=1 Tax=Mucilaginibacter sp. PPCGB 2223 TaxID=1886027 RepID=UPI0008263C6B|nr:ferritin-like domain-containing protein [Mucilaginibacter sp. PPCGB 2223]OCX50875.1 dessication-associated protein [Mucilaginibacter sp. PPCGB 2223]
MNIFSIIEEIEKVDPEFQDRISPRRDAIKNITSFGSKVAVAALPFALGALFKKAYGQTTVGDVNGTLNFALKLEYLEAAFYNTALNTPGLIPAADLAAFQTIAAHENAHVSFLKAVLGSAAVTQTSQGTAGVYDWTAGGTLPNYFATKDYTTFLIVANAFEDTGVRAYKGQAPFIIGNQTVLTAALNIHSVEARHASHIRTIRRKAGNGTTPKSWITGANDTGFAGIAANYAGEDNTMQGGVDVSALINPVTGAKFSASACTEAFDEPLTYAQVLPLVQPFGVK